MTSMEEKLKAAELEARQCANQGDWGPSVMTTAGKSARLGLRDRVALDRSRAMEQGARAQRLQELEYLLDKHPEIARMLDLIEEVGR